MKIAELNSCRTGYKLIQHNPLHFNFILNETANRIFYVSMYNDSLTSIQPLIFRPYF
jgi:hypothetical protein